MSEETPARPAWLNFEQEPEETTNANASSSPEFKTDPRGEPTADRANSLSVAMQEDELQIEGQRYAVISFVSPNGTFQHSDNMLLKIRGVFPTIETARERAAIVKTFDPVFDIFIIDMWRWIPFPPRPNIKREGDERVTEILNTFFDRTETSQSDMRARVEAARQAGKAQGETAASLTAEPAAADTLEPVD